VRIEAVGGRIAAIDFKPFFEAGRMLFDRPWVAERMAAFGDVLSRRWLTRSMRA